MNEVTIKSKILEFLKEHELCVISTIHADGSGPQSAVVGFAETEDLEIIFGTSNKTRKYKNLQSNPNVSFVIGWSSEEGSIQYEGVATELPKGESEKYSSMMVKKNPDSEKYVDMDDQRYFLVKPKWIRFSDNAGNPPDVYELGF